MADKKTTFDPQKNLTELRGRGGSQLYLAVKDRLLWLHSENDILSIETEILEHKVGEYAVVRARVTIGDPIQKSATGIGSETKADFGDYLEKAETKAVGRALGMIGYGTQYAGYDFSYEDAVVAVNEVKPDRNKFPGVDSGIAIDDIPPTRPAVEATVTPPLTEQVRSRAKQTPMTKEQIYTEMRDHVNRLGVSFVTEESKRRFNEDKSSNLNAEQMLELLEWMKTQ